MKPEDTTIQKAVNIAACRLSDGVTAQQAAAESANRPFEFCLENRIRLDEYVHLKEAVRIVERWEDE